MRSRLSVVLSPFGARAKRANLVDSRAERASTPRAFALSLALLGASFAGAACDSGGDMAITGLNPRAGHIAGDQTVEIQGKNFRMDIGYAVYFGKAKAGNVTIRSSEAIMVTSPSGTPGAVDVTVRPDNGAAYVLKQAFKYEDMGGSVVEGLGKPGKNKDKGNLAF